MDFVTYNRLNFYLDGDTLKLTNRGVRDISEIKGLENYPNLEELNLSYNRLQNLNGLEKLTNLKKVILKNNKVIDLRGLGSLINLREIDLENNNIKFISLYPDNISNLDLIFRKKIESVKQTAE